ncbi:DUF3141 domain-containing protein [Halovulum sp. GXIMD14794]
MAAQFASTLPTPASVFEYWTDAWQRNVLFLDTMRKRAEQYEAHSSQTAPHVLDYKVELVVDGRRLERPVNYMLVRVLPPEDQEPDPLKRPFVIVDPRAGHGPGIGGFKADSEIGVAMKAGHPAYFIGFLPDPVPGQTIEDIAHAEAQFLETVIARHPEAEGKPCVIGNCQAGWAVMIVAALRPELFGPIIIAGAPLSYWAGLRGQYPMRYSGGLLGGSWLTAMTGDMGAGIFDGAWLVQNFEIQNPANTLWTKQYNLWANIDTEVERYLGFEKWWGGHVTLNAEEMQWIVDQLFVGNHLSAGEVRTSDGTAVDLRNIRTPMVVFCSRGDNITPPQQALGWILDLYDSVEDIRAHGQTIVYTVHDRVGHLGIFVSGGVARKEHEEFATNIELIDVLPPGLYEAVLTPRGEAVDSPDLVTGEWIMRCERRTLDDIRALGGNDLADERKFDTAARLSEINLALYRVLAQPAVRAMVSPPLAAAMRDLHPLRLSYEIFGARNPFLAWVEGAAASVREDRRPAAADNPLVAFQEQVSRQVVDGLEAWRKAVETLSEDLFHAVYGSPALQAALGVDRGDTHPPRKAARSPLHAALVAHRIEELREEMDQGGLTEALVRALVHVGTARGRIDERGFEAIRRLSAHQPARGKMTLAEFKELVRTQFFMLLIDGDTALEAIPALLPADMDTRRKAFATLHRLLEASGKLSGEPMDRLQRIAGLFGLGSEMVTLGPNGTKGRKAS